MALLFDSRRTAATLRDRGHDVLAVADQTVVQAQPTHKGLATPLSPGLLGTPEAYGVGLAIPRWLPRSTTPPGQEIEAVALPERCYRPQRVVRSYVGQRLRFGSLRPGMPPRGLTGDCGSKGLP